MKQQIAPTKLGIILSLLVCLFATQAFTQSKRPISPKKAKNIILLIGDGMGTAQIYAGIVARKDATNLERMDFIGFSKTTSSSHFITDSAAGATALSIGQKTYNGAIGVDSTGKPVETILETAEKKGLSTGLVATSTITHATPASFIAHVPSRKQEDDIALDFLKTDIDVFIGGGLNHFSEKRKDGKSLIPALQSSGYQVFTSPSDIATLPSKGKIAALIYPDAMPPAQSGLTLSEGMYKKDSTRYIPRKDILPQAASKAIEVLAQNPKGFFLMIEGSQIDWGGHAKNLPYILSEQVDFDMVLGKVLDFAEKNGETLVIVTADHETGGLAITGGNLKNGEVQGAFIDDEHTGVMVPVFAYGPGAELFKGIYHNTALYHKMRKAIGL